MLLQRRAYSDSGKKVGRYNGTPLKIKPAYLTVAHFKCGKFLVCQILEIGLDKADDPVVCYEDICFFVIFKFIQQVINTLRRTEHGFTVYKRIDEVLFCFIKTATVAGTGSLPDPEVLLDQSRFLLHRNPGNLRNMSGCICCPDQGRIQDQVRLISQFQKSVSCNDRLLMAFICKGNICRSADFILKISLRFTVSDKI